MYVYIYIACLYKHTQLHHALVLNVILLFSKLYLY